MAVPEPKRFARFPGTCATCARPINAGDPVTWDRNRRGVRWHHECPPPPDDTPPAPAAIAAPPAPAASDALAGTLAAALAPYLDERLRGIVDVDAVRAIVREELDAAPATSATLTVRNATTGTTVTLDGPVHAMFPRLLYLVSRGRHVYLVGRPGSGKSTAAHQAARALARDYAYLALNPQTPESRLLGFIDAGGTYRETPFFRWYRDGGVFCIDEMDNAAPALLTTLNGLLENGHGAFPCGIIPRHPDAVMIATGNTNGRGGDVLFPERRPFDAAFMERFAFLTWDYDTALEDSLVRAVAGDGPGALRWLAWCRDVRDYCTRERIRLFVSPRASVRGATTLADPDAGWSVADVADAEVFKGLDPATVARILDACPLPVLP